MLRMRKTPIETTLEGFAQVMEAGLVSHIGACNIDAAKLSAAMEASACSELPRYEWVHNEYNLLNRHDEQVLFERCTDYGIGYTPYSPLAGGVLSGNYVRGDPPPPESRLALRAEGQAPSNAAFDAIAKLGREAKRRRWERRRAGAGLGHESSAGDRADLQTRPEGRTPATVSRSAGR